MIEKSLLLSKFHPYIRMWYISHKLPDFMTKDSDIIPYFTPCNGHSKSTNNSISDFDEIDGVMQMQAYCKLCSSSCKYYENWVKFSIFNSIFILVLI